ncbi:MAG: TMEM143 family protein [Cellvibrionaceae bacterium]
MSSSPVSSPSGSNATTPLRFIPFRRQDIVDRLQDELNLSSQGAGDFQQLAKLLNSLLHFEFHQVLEDLKQAYAPLDPNADTLAIKKLNIDSGSTTHGSLKSLLEKVLDKANYERVTQSDLEQALEESSLFKIRLQVDFDEFDEVLLFCRGESQREETLSQWFGLKKTTLSFTNYDRVVVYLKFRDQLTTDNPYCSAGSTLLKLFQDVPKADLEMLFPNTRVRMRFMDKLLIGVPAAVGGGVVVSTKLGGSLILLASLAGYWLGTHDTPVELDKTALLALAAGLGALGAHFWKQFNNFKNRKLRFIQTLTQNLYFKNLDNNAGVFHRLLDEAEEEEGKEALLAYAFLLQADRSLSLLELDTHIERWFERQLGCRVDFEIDDAIQKLIRFGLVSEQAPQSYRAVSVEEALRLLDQRWDNLFPYANDQATKHSASHESL